MGISLAELTALFGKEVEDPAVKKLLAKAGKVVIKPEYVIAKEAGFDFTLGRPKGAKKKQLDGVFLFDEGRDKHRKFAGMPKPFVFGVARTDLIAAAGAPLESWIMGKGKVKADTKGVERDTWNVDGVMLLVEYNDDGIVDSFFARRSEEETGGRDLTVSPLHFGTKPADAPDGAGLVGAALLVAWAAEAHGLPAKHAGHAIAKRGMTPRTFLVEACGKRLTTNDFAPKLADFLWNYCHDVLEPEAARAKTDKPIAKLLRIEDPERRTYDDDFLGTFADLDSPFYVPDSWDAVDRIAPVIAARYADFLATGFLTAPDVKLYEKAAKQRDALKIVPDKKGLAPVTLDAGYADELVGLLGRSLKDKAVKAVLERAGLPVGKRIDQQANPALGVSYMGTKIDIAGKQELGVDTVWFYADKYKSYIRGIGAEVEFRAYPAALPHGLAIGMARADVTKKLGKPARTDDNYDSWKSEDRTTGAEFVKGKLAMLRIGLPKNY